MCRTHSWDCSMTQHFAKAESCWKITVSVLTPMTKGWMCVYHKCDHMSNVSLGHKWSTPYKKIYGCMLGYAQRFRCHSQLTCDIWGFFLLIMPNLPSNSCKKKHTLHTLRLCSCLYSLNLQCTGISWMDLALWYV